MADINKYLDISRAELIKQGNRLMNSYYTSLAQAQTDSLDEIKKVYGEYLSNVEPTKYNAVMNDNGRLRRLLSKVDNILVQVDTKPLEQQSKVGTDQYYYYLFIVGASFVDIPDSVYYAITGRTLDGVVTVDGKRWTVSDYLKKFVRDPKVRQDLIDKYIAKGGDSTVGLITDITDEMRTRIDKLIRDSIARGDNYQQIARDLKKKLGLTAGRAETIARNELLRALHASEYAAYQKAKEQGINPDRYLIAVNDDRTRRQSTQVDGLVADPKDDLFHYNGHTAPMPKQWGVPAYDINDREQVGYRFKDDDKVRIEKGTAVSQFKQSFADWAKDNGLKKNRYGELLG